LVLLQMTVPGKRKSREKRLDMPEKRSKLSFKLYANPSRRRMKQRTLQMRETETLKEVLEVKKIWKTVTPPQAANIDFRY